MFNKDRLVPRALTQYSYGMHAPFTQGWFNDYALVLRERGFTCIGKNLVVHLYLFILAGESVTDIKICPVS